jgi:hypothetical protein
LLILGLALRAVLPVFRDAAFRAGFREIFFEVVFGIMPSINWETDIPVSVDAVTYPSCGLIMTDLCQGLDFRQPEYCRGPTGALFRAFWVCILTP